MTDAGTAAALSLAIGAAAYIIAKAKISMRPRMWLAKRQSKPEIWLFELVSCPLCTSTWLALFGTAIYRPWIVHLWWPLDYLVTSLAITAISQVVVLIIRKGIE